MPSIVDIHPTMYLPRPDSTVQTFCECFTFQRQPCNGYVTFASDGTLIEGFTVVKPMSKIVLYFCTYACMARYSKKFA